MTFSTDWTASITHWPDLFDAEGYTDGEPFAWRFLEVGCFEGRTTLWLLDHVLTHEAATITVVDPFTARYDQLDRFTANIGDRIGKVEIIEEHSSDALPALHSHAEAFDFIYIDGDHRSDAVLLDAVIGFHMLMPDCMMIFDDYDWPEQPLHDTPKPAVDAFVDCYERKISRHGRCGNDQYYVVKSDL